MRKALLCCVLPLVAAGCVSGAGDDDASSSGHTVLRAMSVTGTNGVQSSGAQQVVIDPSQNGGQFRLAWDAVSSTRPHRVEWSVSTDSTLSSGDRTFFARNCDQSFGDCQGQANAFVCTYDNAVRITCAQGGPGDVADMGSYFSANGGLPNNYYLILEVCNGMLEDCVTASVPASFR